MLTEVPIVDIPDNALPYEYDSEFALVELARKEKPNEKIEHGFVEFGDLFFSPIPGTPGRTSIEMLNLITGVKRWFTYRRLDVALLPFFLTSNKLTVNTSKITPEAIVKEVNRRYNTKFSENDVDMGTRVVGEAGTTFFYPLTAKPGSYMYYGKIVLEITSDLITDLLLTETGVPISSESGSLLLTE